EDPRRSTSNDFPLTIDDKEVFRLSIASQQSSTTTTTATSTSSSQRLSVASCEDDNHVAYSPSAITRTTLSPSSRYLLSGSTTSENFRNKVLSRFVPSSSSRHQKSLSEPTFDVINNNISSLVENSNNTTIIDPWCMSAKFAIDNSINSDWMHKYEQPSTFAFGRSWKRRLFILVDRIVFIFKTAKATNPAREHFLLTDDTFVFVTEEFKKGYIIELRKPLCKWYIRCDSVTQMRSWLESMKKIVACIKIGYEGLLSTAILSSITLTDDYRILIPTVNEASKKLNRQSLPVRPISRVQQRQSLAEIPDWETILPPQMPPPRSKPPPVPPCLPTVSEDD
ncbi:hypothetical protein INT47_009346, partial [Mucor saturninus]